MRPLEHGNGGVVGERFPEGSVTASVTGDGCPIAFAPSASDLDRGDVLAGRFQIEAVIGTGGSGRVLRAFDRESRMLVALKILRRELAGEAVWAERFARELRVGRAISHPNVCRVFDIGEADGHRFLSMELATGGSLRADVPKVDAWQAARREKSPREWTDRISDARAIVAGVTALHQEGIVHRDLKPENILRMHDGRLVVTDFGLATDPGSGPGTTIMVGTPSYMAPEVVMGDPATMRSDVWGLGVVLHEIFFGLRPQWKVHGRGYRRFVRPEAARTTVELAVADLCGRCADDDPQSRPETAGEAGRELERALRGKRVIARRVKQRIMWAATVAAAIAGLLVIKTHFANLAVASSSETAGAISLRPVRPAGTAADWSKGSKKIAALPGRLHCYASIDRGRKVRVVWGTPRTAEDIDLETGIRAPSPVQAETYQDGCPAQSPDATNLLYERASDTGSHIFLSDHQGAHGKQLVRGTGPLWLPNGQEFVMTVDARHIGLFSIPTGEMTLVTDEAAGPRLLVDYAVSSSGKRLAILYRTETVDELLVVHALPGLEVLGRLPVSSAGQRLQFNDSDSVSIAMNGASGVDEMVDVELVTTSLHRQGAVPHWDVRGTLRTGAGLFVFARQLRNDLWLENSGTRRPLTADGVSVHGSMSPSGDLVIQRSLSDGRFVIVSRNREGIEQQLTEGPMDATPTFHPDGKSWIYSKADLGELVRCNVATRSCAKILTDPLLPGFASIDPSGRQVAYLTLMNNPRLRIAALDGGPTQDLGPAGDTCAPIWTKPNRLWVGLPSIGTQMPWAEIDTDTRLRTGNVLSAPIPPQQKCGVPSGLGAAAAGQDGARVSVVLREISQVIRSVQAP